MKIKICDDQGCYSWSKLKQLNLIKPSFSCYQKGSRFERQLLVNEFPRYRLLQRSNAVGGKKPQEINAQETHCPHDHDPLVGKDNICSKRRSSTAYFTLFSKGPVFSDQALFWCWAQIDQGVCTAWQKAILSDALLLYGQFPVVKRH